MAKRPKADAWCGKCRAASKVPWAKMERPTGVYCPDCGTRLEWLTKLVRESLPAPPPVVPAEPTEISAPTHTGFVFHIRADGACQNNGSANASSSYGWQVRSHVSGRVLGSGGGTPSGPLHSNNVAEWCGLVAALEWVSAQRVRPGRILIEMDSKLVIETLNGRWRSKAEHLTRLRDKARRLLGVIGCPWQARWIPRAENAECDAISRQFA